VLFTEANLGKFDSNLGKIHSISPKVSKEANLGKSDSDLGKIHSISPKVSKEANLGKSDSNLGKSHSISPKVSKEANLGKSDPQSWQIALHSTKGRPRLSKNGGARAYAEIRSFCIGKPRRQTQRGLYC